jgi:peptidyl-prolyl cis-trans isomerase D
LYDGRDYSVETIPAEYKDFAFGKGVKKGACTELSFADDTYSIARVMECGYNKADSVKLVLVANDENTEDVELGWFKASDLQKNIAEPAFNGKKGSTFTVNMGMSEQTYLIADKSVATPKAKVAILCRKVTPSTKTYGQLYNQAKQFIVANNNADSLHQAAIAQGLSVTPVYALNANTDKVNDLKGSRSIVKWAFEAKEGQVSDVYECGEQFVVAALTQVNDGEYRPIEDVKAELTIQAINNKKAEYITKQLKGINTLEEAAKVFDTEIKTAENISLASYRFGAAGAEPALIGTALAMEPNTVSAPVKGNNGIYMLSVNAAEVAQGDLNAEAEIQQLNMRTAYTIPYQVMSLITEKAEVVDERARIQ